MLPAYCRLWPPIWSAIGGRDRRKRLSPHGTRCEGCPLDDPIVYAGGADLVKYGLAAGLNRPGGNITE